MRASETLGDALRGLEAHLNVQNRGAVVHLEIASGVVVVSLALYEPMGEGAGSIYSDSWGARVPYRTLHSAGGKTTRPARGKSPVEHQVQHEQDC